MHCLNCNCTGKTYSPPDLPMAPYNCVQKRCSQPQLNVSTRPALNTPRIVSLATSQSLFYSLTFWFFMGADPRFVFDLIFLFWIRWNGKTCDLMYSIKRVKMFKWSLYYLSTLSMRVFNGWLQSIKEFS